MKLEEYKPLKENKSHFTTDFLYNTYLCSIPLDFYEVPLHWHNEMELIYIKKGCGIVSVDLERFIVHGGDLVVVMPGHIHSISQNSNDRFEYENIIFNLDMLISRQCDRATLEFFTGISSFRGYCCPVITSSDKHYDELISYIDEADKICQSFPCGYEMKIRGCLFNFFFELVSYFYSAKENTVILSDEKMGKLKSILNYVENNYQNSISIGDISSHCHFSQSHFMKFFKSCTGVSFIEYLNDYRLLVAARMLKSTTLAIIDIASDCGFDNISYFNRKFKAKYGMTPREYRK